MAKWGVVVRCFPFSALPCTQGTQRNAEGETQEDYYSFFFAFFYVMMILFFPRNSFRPLFLCVSAITRILYKKEKNHHDRKKKRNGKRNVYRQPLYPCRGKQSSLRTKLDLFVFLKGYRTACCLCSPYGYLPTIHSITWNLPSKTLRPGDRWCGGRVHRWWGGEKQATIQRGLHYDSLVSVWEEKDVTVAQK